MNKKTVIKHFGSASAVAHALGISPAAVSKWQDLVPLVRASEIELITGGALQVDMSRYSKRFKEAAA